MNLYVALVLALALGGVTGFLAKRRGRNPLAWFSIGVLLGALGLLMLFLLPNRQKTPVWGMNATPPPVQATVMLAPESSAVVLKEHWYYVDAEGQKGPSELQEMTKAWKSGAISAASYVWTAGMHEWKQICDLPLLNERLKN